jgi:hypothetical protein
MRKFLSVILAALIVTIGFGIAYASIPASDGTINGCYKNANGDLIVIDSAASCPSGYTALDWLSGPAGGTIYDAEMGTGSLTVSTTPSGTNATCPDGKVAVAGTAWAGVSGINIPLAVQVASSASFRTFANIQWSSDVPVGSSVSWNITCARVTS